MNHGIYMDIFPLDGYPEEASEQKRLAKLKRRYLRNARCGFDMPRPLKGRIYAALLKSFGCHKRTSKILAKYEALISRYPVNGAKTICNHGTWYGERDYISAEYYGEGSDTMYEGIKVRVPEKCDEYLTALYGDWRTPPPQEKQKGHHYYDVCDTEKPYQEYINRMKKR
jgi:lipopolysaccharide cholinephosphotransferase